MTDRQAQVYEFLMEFSAFAKPMPTYREIADHFGFRSMRAAVDHVRALEKKRLLIRHSGKSRSIELLNPRHRPNSSVINVPILGNIPAGRPEEKTQSDDGTIGVDPAMLEGFTHHRLFALRTIGDSMEGRGIFSGDWVIADADAPFQENDVVVALIDGKNTLKTLDRRRGRFFLKAENPSYPDIIPVAGFIIQGVVKALLRRIA